MKRIFASAVAVVAMASSVSAFAATTDFILTSDILIDSTAPTPSGLALSNFYITTDDSPNMITATLAHTVGNGSFLDRYIFAPTFMSIGAGSSVTNSANQLSFDNPGLTVTEYTFASTGSSAIFDALSRAFSTPNIEDYTADVATLTAFLNGSPVAANTYLGSPSGLDRQIANVPLNLGSFYVISVSGTGGATGSRYDGNLSATAVPEPATWAMMLAGFGAVGFAMRRRRQSHPQVRFAF